MMLSLVRSYGYLIATSLFFCILVSFVGANFDDNLSIILLVSPPLITANPIINNKLLNDV